MAIRLDDAELDALEGVTHSAFVLYVKLRKRMDYTTGLVGARQGAGVSWQALREELFVEPGPGLSDTGAPHKSSVKRLVKRLIRAGLVTDKTINGSFRLVFELRLAVSDNSVRKQPDPIPTLQTSSMCVTPEALNSMDSFTYCEGDPIHFETPQPDPHPVSGNTKEKLPISRDFFPSGETKARCVRAGCPTVDQDEIDIFIARQVSDGNLSEDWQESFYGWMIRAKKFAASRAVYVSRGADKQRREPWESIPVDNNKLMAWASKHGFAAPKYMATNFDYRRDLEGQVRRRRDEIEKVSSPS